MNSRKTLRAKTKGSTGIGRFLLRAPRKKNNEKRQMSPPQSHTNTHISQITALFYERRNREAFKRVSTWEKKRFKCKNKFVFCSEVHGCWLVWGELQQRVLKYGQRRSLLNQNKAGKEWNYHMQIEHRCCVVSIKFQFKLIKYFIKFRDFINLFQHIETDV